MSVSKTAISWTDATWNPAKGCSRVSEGCRHCYAEKIAARFSGPGGPFHGFAHRIGGEARWTGKVELIPEALDWPLRRKKPLRIFVNSMSDLFHEGLSNEDIAAVFGVMAACPRHTFQVLTKRSRRMREWFEWIAQQGSDLKAEVGVDPSVPGSEMAGACHYHAVRVLGIDGMPITGDRAALHAGWPLKNVWLGVSAEDQATLDARVPDLLRCPAAVRWVSLEPQLGPVDVERYLGDNPLHGTDRRDGGGAVRCRATGGASSGQGRVDLENRLRPRQPLELVAQDGGLRTAPDRLAEPVRVSMREVDAGQEAGSLSSAQARVQDLRWEDTSGLDDQPRERPKGRQPAREPESRDLLGADGSRDARSEGREDAEAERRGQLHGEAGGGIGSGDQETEGIGRAAKIDREGLRYLGQDGIQDSPRRQVGLVFVVQGGESGPRARPFDIAWARSVRDQCREAGVAYWFKQAGARPLVPACRQTHWDYRFSHLAEDRRFTNGPDPDHWVLHLADRAGADPAEWPEDLRIQQFPEVRR